MIQLEILKNMYFTIQKEITYQTLEARIYLHKQTNYIPEDMLVQAISRSDI